MLYCSLLYLYALEAAMRQFFKEFFKRLSTKETTHWKQLTPCSVNYSE